MAPDGSTSNLELTISSTIVLAGNQVYESELRQLDCAYFDYIVDTLSKFLAG